MIKVKELTVWFLDDSETTTYGDYANDATIDLLRYAMKGLPKFVELHKEVSSQCLKSPVSM